TSLNEVEASVRVHTNYLVNCKESKGLGRPAELARQIVEAGKAQVERRRERAEVRD
ncbi:hypothetical protein LCGC14_1538130, partial [marine sediment metagenome]